MAEIHPYLHHRHSIRLPEYDYSQPGGYFVTIATVNHSSIFGKVVDGNVQLSNCGEIARKEWFTSAAIRPYIDLYEDEFIVMPNHIHGIIWVKENEFNSVGAQRRCAPTYNNEKFSVGSQTLSAIVCAYKSAVTYKIHELLGEREFPIWQRNYYEHIIRDEQDYENIFNYIVNNPANWKEDSEFK